MKRFDQLDILINHLGESATLDALVKAMSDDDFEDNFKYICQQHDIKIEEEEEEEEGEE